LGGWQLFRVVYYAELFPNTYYLKGHSDWSQGLWYLASSVVGQWWMWLFPICWVGVYATHRIRHDQDGRDAFFPKLAMILAAAAVLIWVARIGGDMIYHRFVAFPTTLLLCSIAGSGEIIVEPIKRVHLRNLLAGLWTAAAFGLSLASYPPSLAAPPWTNPKILHWHKIAEAQWHRQHPHLAPSPERVSQDRQLLDAYADIVANHTPQTRVLVSPWCRNAFFAPSQYVINLYGLTDAILARIESDFGRPGHRLLGQTPHDIAAVIRLAAGRREPGIYRSAVKTGKAARWIKRNLATIEMIERKIYNRHRFLENLNWAFQPVGRIPVSYNFLISYFDTFYFGKTCVGAFIPFQGKHRSILVHL
jgi:hypothetical protein